jgi:hypothetical protein
METYREYCVVAVNRSKYGNTYKELFRGRRKDCHRFVTTYCKRAGYVWDEKEKSYCWKENIPNGKWVISISCVLYDVCIKEVKGDNSIYNTMYINDFIDKPDWDNFFYSVRDFK